MKFVPTSAAATVLASFFCPANCDLPIHCLHREVVGTWELHVGASSTEKDRSCGHEQPDDIMTMPNDGIDFHHPGFPIEKKLSVTLSEPNKAVDSHGHEGTWTMVYDEGFEIEIGSDKYLTFFKYAPLTEHYSKTEAKDFHSYCDVTVSGWHTAGTENSCFVAAKSKPKALIFHHDDAPCSRKPGHDHSHVLIAVEDPDCTKSDPPRFRATHAALEAQLAETTHRTRVQRSQGFSSDSLFHVDHATIDRINADKDATWTAKAHEHLEGSSVSDILNMLGRRRFQVVGEQKYSPLTHAVLAPVAHVNVLEVSHTSHNYGFPKIFDWRKIDGGVYMTPVIQQGGCGSCYAVASTDVATMRYRIKHGKDRPEALKTRFSPQNVLGCSRTNQGCDGGYPLLVGRHGVELGFVPESCQPYEGDNSCNSGCLGGEKVVHARKSEYIGGYYGAGNEVDMLKALKRGPIVVAVNAPPDLLYFHSGVYSHPLAHDHDEYDVNGISRWEKTNHAIAAVGWGEEILNGELVKYWICKNSWGDRWGDDGYFYVRRGNDAMAIESMAVEISF